MAKKKVVREYDDLDEREIEFDRPMEHLLFQDDLYIPPHIIPKDKKYYWARKMISVTGHAIPDAGRIGHLISHHWRPVPADRHPELALYDYDEDDLGRSKNRFIDRKGSRLMEIDKPYYESMMRAMNAYTMKAQQQAGLEEFAGNRMMPSRVFNEFESGEQAHRERGKDLTFNY